MTKSNTSQSAAPARILPGTASLVLAALVACELTGLQALSHVPARWTTAAAADGSTVYTQVGRADATDTIIVAQAAY